MFPRTNATSLRRCCCTHSQCLLSLLLCLWCWTISHLSSPYTWTLDEAEIRNFKEEDAPAISHNRVSPEKCLDDLKSINCKNNSTTVSRYPYRTSDSITVTLKEELQYRHPNFTFDFPLCLVHVGKTAGSSISCGLGLMYADCEGMPRQPPLLHTDYFHMRKNNCRGNDDNGKNMATFLMTVRNPLTRIQSWFNFEKDIFPTRRNKQEEERLRWKRGMLFSICYDNFVDFVLEGLELPLSSTSNKNTYEISTERPINMTCRERAWAAILGVREFSYHEWYNYEHYWTALQNLYFGNDSNSSFLVLRAEHLSEDWSKLSKEELFRQVNKGRGSLSFDDNLNISSSRTYTSQKSGQDDFVHDHSSRFWSNLCHAMCPEIQIYQRILERANNINTSQLLESISEVQKMCPRYSFKQSNCPGIPQFPLIKVPRRRYLAETKKRLFVIG